MAKRARTRCAALLFAINLVACGGSATTSGPSSSGGAPGSDVAGHAGGWSVPEQNPGGGTGNPYPEVGGGTGGPYPELDGGPGTGGELNAPGSIDVGMAGYANVTGPDGLRANYHFDEKSGAYAVDSLSQARGPVYLASRIDGVSGKALSFGAPGSRVELPALGPFATGEISIELWLRPASLAPDAVAHLVGDGGGGVQSFRLELHGGKVALLVAPPDGGNAVPIATSQGALDIGRWQLVTVAFDGSTVHIYFDGAEDTAVSIVAPLTISVNTIYVGALPSPDYSSYTDQLDGDADELKIWNVALTPKDVAAHSTASK